MANMIGGCDTGDKIPKLIRTVNVGIRVAGAGSTRPVSGQMYPRGK